MPAINTVKRLYKAGTIKSEKAAIANRDPARKKAAEKIMKREGTTSPSGGRTQAVLRITKGAPPIKPIKLPFNPNKPLVRQNAIIRTTTNMKPTPTAKKK
jgi:hypothetical protein